MNIKPDILDMIYAHYFKTNQWNYIKVIFCERQDIKHTIYVRVDEKVECSSTSSRCCSRSHWGWPR